MSTFAQYEQQFVQDLLQASGSELTAQGNALLTTLIDAFPYYGNPVWNTAHRAAVSNLLMVNLPNEKIAPNPMESGTFYTYVSLYSYDGNYTGYKDAFFNGVNSTAVSTKVAQLVGEVSNGLNSSWWAGFATSVLTDAIRQATGFILNTTKLTDDISNYNNAFYQALSASYLAVLTAGYIPTANAFAAILNSGQASEVASLLNQALTNGEFNANINQAIAYGGDSTTAATWFLFNLWISLKALGVNVDEAISNYKNAGLQVPVEIDSGQWWNGGYTSYFAPITGTDVVKTAAATITASMPEIESTIYSGNTIPYIENVNTANGYSMSFCYWGTMNSYVPVASSCFGKGSMVLMANGMSRAIETITPGEQVMTDKGPRAVVLIEKPKRAGRPLYKFNQLPFSVTAAHPFKAGSVTNAQYCSIDPWETIDSIPSLTECGVIKLLPGIILAAYNHGTKVFTEVKEISELKAEKENSEDILYDLILENWEKDMPAYYVGGPEIFFSAVSETSNPLSHTFVTIAIVTALDILTHLSRNYFNTPQDQIPALFNQLNLEEIEKMARKDFKKYQAGKQAEVIKIPDQEFYKLNGEWDLHASLLEHHLVKSCGRWLEALLDMGEKSIQYTSGKGDRTGVTIYTLELLVESLQANKPASIQIHKGTSYHNTEGFTEIVLPSENRSVFKIKINQTLDLGKVSATDIDKDIYTGILKQENNIIGIFTISIPIQKENRKDVFIFNNENRIIGRVGLQAGYLSSMYFHWKKNSSNSSWTRDQLKGFAVCLGKQLGNALSEKIEVQ